LAAGLGEQFLRLVSKLIRAADVSFSGEAKDGFQFLAAEFVHDDLARRDHDFRDLRAARGFDNDVLTGFETHPGGVEIENLPGVSKAYAGNARQLVRHVPPVLPRGL
jgi:hypothetical protein